LCAGGKWEYVWIGEFGEMENFRWNSLNNSGKKNIGEFGEIPHIVQLKGKGSMSGLRSSERWRTSGGSPSTAQVKESGSTSRCV
jgi:hypothetical protein